MSWQVPDSWKRVSTIDVHVAGEPLRVVTGGFPEPAGDTMLRKRRHAQQHGESLRRALMLEPRGHADMYGCIPTAPVTPDGDLGVLFIHNEGYSTMCGHGIIGVSTVLVECGLVPVTGDLVELGIDTPAGFVRAYAEVVDGGRVRGSAEPRHRRPRHACPAPAHLWPPHELRVLRRGVLRAVDAGALRR